MQHLEKPKILIVDDRPENLLAMKHLLRSLDAELLFAGSGGEALGLAMEHRFALALLDVQMPGMDGFEVAERLHEGESCANLPIIFISSFGTDSEHLCRGYYAGGVDFLSKPIDPLILKSKVSIFLELDRSRRLLEKRNDELQDFAQLAAHDLKAPLRAVDNFSKFLVEDIEDENFEDVKANIEQIHSGVDRMTRLIDGLLGFAKAGRMDNSSDLVDLNEVADEAMELLGEPCREASAQVEWSSLPTVRGNRSRLIQLMQNLMGNAIKFRGDQTPVIRLEAELEANTWVLRLIDNGIGIEEQDREAVFAPLKRLHAANKYEGTGIGLASCRKIVEFHGGTIWIEPRDAGDGSMFCFTFPTAA